MCNLVPVMFLIFIFSLLVKVPALYNPVLERLNAFLSIVNTPEFVKVPPALFEIDLDPELVMVMLPEV